MKIESPRITLKAIHEALEQSGNDVRLEKGHGYFYFWSGEANAWLDRTVKVPTLNSLSLEQWVDAFLKLKKLNQELLNARRAATPAACSKPKRKNKAS